MPPEDKRPLALGPTTLVPVGVLVAICGVLIGFTSWMGERFNSMNGRFNSIETRLELMRVDRESTNAVMLSHWTKAEQELWAERLKSSNPNIVLPVSR